MGSRKKPAEFELAPMGLTICQPGDLQHCKDNNFGLYRHASVKELCKKIYSESCFDLNDLRCEDDKKCLKWGRNAWAGRALVPAGVEIKGYGNYNCHRRRHFSTGSGGHEGTRWDFWEFHKRIKSFKMYLMKGYECVGDVVQMTLSANRYSFKGYVGSWQRRGGGGAQLKLTAAKSWGTTNSKAISNAFKLSITRSAEVGFGGNSVTSTAAASFSNTVKNTLTRMSKEGSTISCTSPKCDGRLYQWVVSATMVLDNKQSAGKQIVQECDFVCVPSRFPQHIGPKCPKGYCGDLEAGGGCQCCNSNYLKSGMSTICEGSKQEL